MENSEFKGGAEISSSLSPLVMQAVALKGVDSFAVFSKDADGLDAVKSDRDLSWIDFNDRVLSEAEDPRTPLLERVKFVQIFTTNLDEFYMKRMGPLQQSYRRDPQTKTSGHIPVGQVLGEIQKRVTAGISRRNRLWSEVLVPALAREGVLILSWGDLTKSERSELTEYFHSNIFPVLTPLAVDPGHPFPFISNLANSLGVVLRGNGSLAAVSETPPQMLFARIKIPSQLPGWITLKASKTSLSGDDTPSSANSYRLISLTEVVSVFVDSMFPGMEILETFPFRITRNSEVEKDDGQAQDLLQLISEELKERRFGEIVRLEIPEQLSPRMREYLMRELRLVERDGYDSHSRVDYSELSAIWSLPRAELKYLPWTPVTPTPLMEPGVSTFDVIRTRDLLVHHPYQSFAKTVERFLLEAVEDPDVLAIKMTLYRTGSQSPFVPLLIRAAEAGKQVVALVELKARFDEERNIRVARQLERAGVHVVYGVVGYKTHCKMALVVRREADQIRSYVHLGTGNYHPKTSQVYTDLGLFTADPEICKDVVELFHFLTGRSLKRNYRKLLVAPVSLKEHLVFMIRREIDATKSGRPARIIAKMNGLDDPEVISALRKAAIAGVRIDLIVRGTCCLGPQDLPAVAASNLRIVSILGRFLEHSRVVYFQNSATDELGGEFYIGSADWMRRNLNSRVECLIPVRDAIARSELWDFLQLLLADRRQAWELDRLGKYVRLQPETSDQNLGVHERLMRTFKRQSQSKLLDSDSPEFPTWASVPRLDSHLSI